MTTLDLDNMPISIGAPRDAVIVRIGEPGHVVYMDMKLSPEQALQVAKRLIACAHYLTAK